MTRLNIIINPKILTGIIHLFFLNACIETSQNTNTSGENILKTHSVDINIPKTDFRDTVYVPIYSEIYSETKNTKFLLTATLSIRNTSFTDSIFISTIDYYNTAGELVRTYLDNYISLKPLETIDYVIEEKDISGGTGANFIIIWSAKKNSLKPIFQGVMISTNGQQGISYITEGISISKNQQK